jgi:hypothetical protein
LLCSNLFEIFSCFIAGAQRFFVLCNENGHPLSFKVLAQFPGFSAPALPRVNPGFNQM